MKERARNLVSELVRAFKHNEDDYLHAAYNETQARTDFITPLLEAFGWDVHNRKRQPLALREVVEEATVEVGEERLSKKPDYELRLARQRKLFVEAKKPSVRIDRDRAPAFQIRRYGYSASLPIAVLTNFHQLAVYDCQPAPIDTDKAHVARLLLVAYEEFEEQFDKLWSLLSRDAVYSGAFDRHFSIDATRRGAEQFDDFFLAQVRDWRKRLASDINKNTPGLSAEELTFAVQRVLSRIVFLRICEDREIEKYETLKNLPASTFNALMDVLRRADAFYDSGLFRLLDDERLGIRISDETLKGIICELYYPRSPYTFAVVETEVLGEIYEQFLGDVIIIDGGDVQIVNKPEVRESGGVVPTPGFIADAILERVLGPAVMGKSPERLENFTVADICCGSGIFLLSAYGLLLEYYLSWYLDNERETHVGCHIYEAGAGQWRLTFEEKRRILLVHLRGVDIDPNAVEVTQFSLLLKLIEDESAAGLKEYVERRKTPALPSLDEVIRCGNSLVSVGEWETACGPMSTALRVNVNPFSWVDEFRAEMERGGFNVIVGNPPYIRIQNMVAYSPKEVTYYQHSSSPFTTSRHNNFDKYAIFIERSLELVKNNGCVGVIVPHKFMTIRAGRALRGLLSQDKIVEQIVHFGVKQVFGRGTSNYTCIMILKRVGCDSVRIEKVGALESWRYGHTGSITDIPAEVLGEEPWAFADEEARALFTRIRNAHEDRLSKVAEILVGVQTSADNVYILHPVAEDVDTVTCHWNEQNWVIEQSILRPCLHDVTLSAYGRPQANAWIIFPYKLVKNAKGSIRAHLIQPDVMATRFPGCWAYLNARRKKLEGRNITGGPPAEQHWYQYGRSQSLTKFDTPKIILPVLSIEPRYAYDEADTLFTGGGNGPYYMVRTRDDAVVSNHYLLAVLNHPLSEALVRINTSTFRGGYYSHGKQFIERLPIPVPKEEKRAEIESLVADLISTLDEAEAARIPHDMTRKKRRAKDLRREIEERMSAVFGLSAADMETVQAVEVPA
ncbi:MAG: Eco57I restriction-modification methylase domain-containing protein [bacterium]